ncbi:MAG: glycosyltransferase family 2 protein [Bacteroidales bacterium]|jgi:GT2 family glycosyltransferase|nr:glycosyltransferase family 2 protein [Bacteroidales bacterium]MBQ2514040.1 glycosyltransferase family 2 protein [Bacteroidales bacterium]MBR6904702.1 glycosyltransferase family 2 protein [Bacteroidales bacterium]MCR4874011.1 glycosyltransferase family 2 protein [Bacteroidales bacterium]
MSKLAIVILNWNGKRFLERFLPTLLRTLPDYAEVVVCDNASKDDSVAFMEEHFPQVKLLLNERNEGFARGYNLALQRVEAKYYCLLNSDIEVTDGWIEPVIEQMDANEKIAAVQPKLRSFDRRDEFEYAGASGGYIDKYGYPFCRGRVFSNVEKDRGQYDDVIDIFWATGAAMFVRSDVYHLMEGLDGDFFAHMEEIDFCWRIKNLGYKIKVNPASVVYHIGGGTLPKNNSYKTFLNFRNSLYLLIKNLPEERLAKTLILRFFLDQVAAFSFLAQGHFKDFTAVYKAIFTFARTYKQFYAKRNTFPKLAFQDCYPESVVKLHYLKRKKIFDGKSFS